MKQYFPNKGYDVLYLLIFLYLLSYALLGAGYHMLTMKGEFVGDSLFNYGGGFIRRGLSGEILFFIKETLHIPVAWSVYLISIAAYFFLLVAVGRKFARKGYGLNVLIMSFTFGAILIYGFDACRRDFIELSLLAIVLILYRRLPFGWWLAAGNILMMFGISLHEATFFFTVPILAVITNRRMKSVVKSCLVWLPSFLMFCLCCLCKGTPEMYPAVIGRAMEFSPESFPDGEIPSLLTYIAKGAGDVFRMHLSYNFTGLHYIGSEPVPSAIMTLFYFAYIPYMAVSMLISFTPGGIKATSRNRLVRLIVFQFICLMPMFTFLSCDIGRVACYWIMSSILVWIYIDSDEDACMLERCGNGIDTFSNKIFTKRVPGKKALTVLMLSIGVVYYIREPLALFTSSLGGRVFFVTEKYIETIQNFLS